jgi:hypothetical protein
MIETAENRTDSRKTQVANGRAAVNSRPYLSLVAGKLPKYIRNGIAPPNTPLSITYIGLIILDTPGSFIMFHPLPLFS